MKKKIIHLSSFKNIGVLHTTFKSFFELLSQNFDEIIIVNIDNLQLFSKKNIQYSNYKIRKKFPKKVKFFNPKNFQELKDKTPVTPDQVDCIIVCSQNPDGDGLPHCSAIVHENSALETKQHPLTFHWDVPDTCIPYP